MTTTITSDDTATAVVFYFDAHTAEGQRLRAELADKVAELVTAELDDLAATAAVDRLDILSDTDSKITKTRLAAERTAARVNQAAAAERAARRAAEGHNADVSLVEALRPMLTKLTGGRPGIGLHVLPAEPDWSAVTLPSLVAIQQTPAVADRFHPGRLQTPLADQFNAVRLVYVHDPHIHRDLLSDRAGVLSAAEQSGVDLRNSDRPGRPEGVAVNSIRPRKRELAEGIVATEVALHVAAYPEIPTIATEDFSADGFAAGVRRRAQRINAQAEVGSAQVRLEIDPEGRRIAHVMIPITTTEDRAELAADLHKWKGHAAARLGRVVEVKLGSGYTTFVAASLTK